MGRGYLDHLFIGPVSVVFIAGNYKLIFEMSELKQKE